MDEGFRTKEITVVRLQKALELCVPEQTSYGELKSVVRTSLNIPACRQRFRVAGAAVEDDDVPMEGVRVELMVDLRGGGVRNTFLSSGF